MSNMNPRVKKLWLKALRSGKYKRATKRLKADAGYCCLGVLCDLYIKSKDGKTNKAKWDNDIFKSCAINREDAFLPQEVQKWAGLGSFCPVLSNGISLCHINDFECENKRKGFKWVADLIEKGL